MGSVFVCFYQYRNHKRNHILHTGPSKLLSIRHSSVFTDTLSTWTVVWRGATSTSAVDKLSVRTLTGCGSTHKVVPLVLTRPGEDYIRRETPPFGRSHTELVRDDAFVFFLLWLISFPVFSDPPFYFKCHCLLERRNLNLLCLLAHLDCSTLILDNVGMYGMRFSLTVKRILKKWPLYLCMWWPHTHTHTGSN